MSIMQRDFSLSTDTLRRARLMVMRPDGHSEQDLRNACGYMEMCGDHADVARGKAMLDQLDLEAAALRDRNFVQIVRDIPLTDWIGGVAIFASLAAIWFLLSVYERMVWVLPLH